MYQPMIFAGEEISVTVRAFTTGYDFFSLGKSVCFRVFAKGPNEEKRERVPIFSENKQRYIKIDTEYVTDAYIYIVSPSVYIVALIL